MELRIKNMVCARCIKSIESIFQQLEIKLVSIELGRVIAESDLSSAKLEILKSNLLNEGFEVLDDNRSKLIDEIKQAIISLVHYGNLDEMNEKLSVYLAGKLNKEYNYLSNTFSASEDYTIEQYFILQKIEKIKEWLVYDELTLSEMSFRLGYSSVAHLSNQFKKVTGFTPSQYKKLKDHRRKPLDAV